MAIDSVISDAQVGQPVFSLVTVNAFFQQMETDIEEGFLNTQEFADVASYVHSLQGETIVVNGIFDNEYIATDPGSTIEVVSSQPVFITKSSYFTIEAEPDDYMLIRGNRYKVERHEPDGTGITVIYLHYKV